MTLHIFQPCEDADIFCVHIGERRDEIARRLDCLSSTEREQASRFAEEEDQARFVFGRSMLRDALSARLDIAASEVEFQLDANGKPHLRGRLKRAPYFNVSHSGDVVLVVVSDVAPVGIDVERTRSGASLDELIASICSDEERRQFDAAAEPLREIMFWHLWTRKEAVLKAAGLGLNDRVREYRVPLSHHAISGEPAHFQETGACVRKWAVYDLKVPFSGYIAAFAIDRCSCPPRGE